MQNSPNLDAARTWAAPAAGQPSANAAAVVTLAAVAGQVRVLDEIMFGYDAPPTGGSLTVTDGVFTIVLSLVDAGPYRWSPPEKIVGGVGNAVTITLAAGGAGVSGKLNVQYA